MANVELSPSGLEAVVELGQADWIVDADYGISLEVTAELGTATAVLDASLLLRPVGLEVTCELGAPALRITGTSLKKPKRSKPPGHPFNDLRRQNRTDDVFDELQ